MSQINKSHHVRETKNELLFLSRVAQWYYKRGLFLSSYLTCASSLALCMALSSCYPLLNIPLPGTIPTKIILPYGDQSAAKILSNSDGASTSTESSSNASHEQPPFPWGNSDPFVHIHQIVSRFVMRSRSSVLPHHNNFAHRNYHFNDRLGHICAAQIVPVIQEFCVFAIVGLISDFYMQMLLSSTVLLALNIRRIEFSNLSKSTNVPDMAQRETSSVSLCKQYTKCTINHMTTSPSSLSSSTSMSRFRSHPKSSNNQESMQPTDMVVAGKAIAETKKIPKRSKIFNFWARTRFFFQGAVAFMLWMIVWICSIVYNFDIFELIFVIETKNHTDYPYDGGIESYSPHGMQTPNIDMKAGDSVSFVENESDAQQKSTYFDMKQYNLTKPLNKLRHPDLDTNLYLSNFHWSSVLRQNNISMSGKYVTVLPTIRISHAITPDEAIYLRKIDEKPKLHFQWTLHWMQLISLTWKEDHLTKTAGYGSTPLYPNFGFQKLPWKCCWANSVGDHSFTYAMIVFYRVICSRNYEL